jgi:hypothetical protein
LDIERIITELEQERDRRSQAITALKTSNLPIVGRKECRERRKLQSAPRRNYAGRQKAAFGDDEETLGREKKKGQIFLGDSSRSSTANPDHICGTTS